MKPDILKICEYLILFMLLPLKPRNLAVICWSDHFHFVYVRVKSNPEALWCSFFYKAGFRIKFLEILNQLKAQKLAENNTLILVNPHY